VPGDPEVRFDALPGSTLPDELRQRGFDVRDLGDGERILAATIVTGIVKVKRYGFSMA
jgi:hypothetical protein